MELKDLVAARGYLKGTLTRLQSWSTCSQSLSSASKETLLAKRQKLIDTFNQYESRNVKILLLHSEDKEDIEHVENSYYFIITAIDAELNRRNSASASETHSTSKSMPKLKLPPIDIQVFSGKFTEFVPFINLFKSLIDNNKCLDDIQKLYYLRSYLKNEPYDLIKNLPLSGESYKEALQIINKRYNNKHRLINEHISLLLDIKPLSKSTANNIREFVSNVKQTLAALSNLEPNVRFWDAVILCILYRKLDAYTSRAFQLERNADEEPTIEAFLNYMDKRALALESADPGCSHGQQRQSPKEQTAGRLVANTATQESSCLYCAAAFRAVGAV